MTRDVVSMRPDTPLLEAATALNEHGFDGVPVVDDQNVLVGILTEYDLISKGSAVHLPTLQKVFRSLQIAERNHIREEMREISDLKVRDVMNGDPLTLQPTASLEETVAVFRDHHRVNPVPVVDASRKVVGVVSRYDIVKLFKVVSA